MEADTVLEETWVPAGVNAVEDVTCILPGKPHNTYKQG
jgi:hypothetical protein